MLAVVEIGVSATGAWEEASLESVTAEHNCSDKSWSKFDGLMLSAESEGSSENT